MKMKLYWNWNYPENVFCLYNKRLHVLIFEHQHPFDGEELHFFWKLTSWDTSKALLEFQEFEYIGEL